MLEVCPTLERCPKCHSTGVWFQYGADSEQFFNNVEYQIGCVQKGCDVQTFIFSDKDECIRSWNLKTREDVHSILKIYEELTI